MRFLIVHAHAEPNSFNGALTREAAASLLQAGHDVIVSDLYAMGFDPVSDRRNFLTVEERQFFKQQSEEEYASERNSYVPELQAEMDKVAWCDVLILQFPLWWFGLPAIMKGWIDRVFAVGRAYGKRRWFDVGVFAGKRAMCSLTVGGSQEIYSDRGIYGPIGAVLFPIHHGILHFTGFAILEPFVVYGPTRITPQERLDYLREYRERVLSIPSAMPLAPPKTADYDERLLLKQT